MRSTGSQPLLRHINRLVARQRSSLPSDGELVQRFVREADERAITILVERHGPMVLRVCRRVLHNLQDAEDAF
jgi:hypothetical protein